MKNKVILLALVALLIGGNSFADNAQRKISTGILTTSQSISTVPGTVYALEVFATAANGFATVFDYAGSSISDLPNEKSLVEDREATQYNSKHIDLGSEGIKAYKGIYIYLSNATAIVHYY